MKTKLPKVPPLPSLDEFSILKKVLDEERNYIVELHEKSEIKKAITLEKRKARNSNIQKMRKDFD